MGSASSSEVSLARLSSRIEKLKSENIGRSSTAAASWQPEEILVNLELGGECEGEAQLSSVCRRGENEAEEFHQMGFFLPQQVRIGSRLHVVEDVRSIVAESGDPSSSSFVVLTLDSEADLPGSRDDERSSRENKAPKSSNSHGLESSLVPGAEVVAGDQGPHDMQESRSHKENLELGALDMEMGLTTTGDGKPLEGEEAAEDFVDGEQICRVCHLGLVSASGEVMELGCACKQDLAMCHRSCAEEWFRIRGNRLCEICGRTVENLPPVIDNATTSSTSRAQTQEGAAAGSTTTGGVAAMQRTSTSTFRYCWQQQLVRNSLLACFVVVFMVPWFFRIAYFTK